jgi:6-phosphofructokinase 1
MTSKVEIKKLLQGAGPFRDLALAQVEKLAARANVYEVVADTVVFHEDEPGESIYVVVSGHLSFKKSRRTIRNYRRGDFFGEAALLEDRQRMGSVVAMENSTIIDIPIKLIHAWRTEAPLVYADLYRGLAETFAGYIKEETELYANMDVLLVQDGGCAPGYNPVTAYLTEYFEKAGREVFAANEGFRSLVSDHLEDYRYLVYSRRRYEKMERHAGVYFAPPLREARGADFRSERFPQFKDPEVRQVAVANMRRRKVKTVIGIGGNGTFNGINDLAAMAPEIQFFFIPVTIDSDIFGTETIGQHTGVEVGAEKIRSYLADARTHHRVYIIEMMGAESGFHALHACLGAGAHLAVIPGVKYKYKEIADAVNWRASVVIAVAEGFAKEERKATGFIGNAADYFRLLLVQNGLKTERRVIAEPFSRDIRGAAPNNLDISLARRLAHNLVEQVKSGKDRVMPATLGGRDTAITFANIKTDNTVAKKLAHLADRLSVKK